MIQSPSKPRRFQFRLRTLLLATLALGGLTVVLFYYDEWNSDLVGEYNIIDADGAAWRVEVRRRFTNNSIPPGLHPKLIFIARSEAGAVLRYKYATGWRFGVAMARPSPGGISVFHGYPVCYPGIRFELKGGNWRVLSDEVYAYESFHQLLDDDFVPHSTFYLPASPNADVDALDARGQTALHRAVAASKEAYVYLLLAQHNADIWILDGEGKSVFDLKTSTLITKLLNAAKANDKQLLEQLRSKIKGSYKWRTRGDSN